MKKILLSLALISGMALSAPSIHAMQDYEDDSPSRWTSIKKYALNTIKTVGWLGGTYTAVNSGVNILLRAPGIVPKILMTILTQKPYFGLNSALVMIGYELVKMGIGGAVILLTESGQQSFRNFLRENGKIMWSIPLILVALAKLKLIPSII